MSSCAVSYCICSPRASFAFATSASSPIGGAPRCCHFAWQHSAQFHPRPNQKLPPLRNRNLFGAAPTVADRWRSSNDSPRLNSNSVLHHCCSLLPHEIARPQPESSARFIAPRPRPSDSRPDPYFTPSVTPSSTIDSRSHLPADLLLCFRNDSRQLQHLSLAPFNFHKSRVRRASGFLLPAFSN